MNRAIHFLLFLSSLALYAQGQISISKDSLNFDNTSNNATIISINAGNDWTFTNNSDWLLAKKISSTMLSIETTSANDKTAKRTTKILISKANKTKAIFIQQDSSEPRLIASKQSITLPYKGGSSIVSISTNMIWEITQSPNWCTLEINESDINITVKQNDSKKSRSGIMIIKAENNELIINLKQRGNGIFDKIQDTADDIIQ